MTSVSADEARLAAVPAAMALFLGVNALLQVLHTLRWACSLGALQAALRLQRPVCTSVSACVARPRFCEGSVGLPDVLT